MIEVAFHQDGDKLRVSIDGKMASEGQVNLVCEDLNDPVMAALITARWQSRLELSRLREYAAFQERTLQSEVDRLQDG
jgi:hypothetical protein